MYNKKVFKNSVKKAVASATKASIDAKAKYDDEIKQIAIEIMAISKGSGKKNVETIGYPDATAVASAIKIRFIMGKAKP